MPNDLTTHEPAAPVERLGGGGAGVRGMQPIPTGCIDDFTHVAEEDWVLANGAKVVARAWTDPDFKRRLLGNSKAAVADLGPTMPEHHKHLLALENTPRLQNVICCTLCSCTAFPVIGLPPGGYKDFEYRSRIVGQSRSVLREVGLALPETVDIRVWDTTANTHDMVLPVQPPETVGWPEDNLFGTVTKQSMIGAARLEAPYR